MRNRLTLILVAALVALLVTDRYRSRARDTAAADPEAGSLLQPLPLDHWAYPALERVSDANPGSTNLAPGPNARKPVTRFEMAVLLSRIMEKLESASGNGKIPWDKIELLDRLCKEFRGDLENIGTDMTSVKAKLEELGKKVDETSKQASANVVKQLFDSKQKLTVIAERQKEQDIKLDSVFGKLGHQSEMLTEGQKKVQVFAEVLAKVLVKMARWEKEPPGENAAETSRGLSRSNLSEIRGLIKDFAVGFERRLVKIERKGGERLDRSETGSRVPVPTATRLPIPALGAPASRGESGGMEPAPPDSAGLPEDRI